MVTIRFELVGRLWEIGLVIVVNSYRFIKTELGAMASSSQSIFWDVG
jgi:hypothetical protein